MKLVVISHKECWINPSVKYGYVSVGGFPLQMRAIAELFTEMRLVTTLHRTSYPTHAMTLDSMGVDVDPLPTPKGTDFRRKLALLTWLPRHVGRLWQDVKQADAVHAPVPGDLGLIGILLALAQRKPLFVRHCGTWGEPVTIADRFLLWLLERIAGGRNVVMATGGGEELPSQQNTAITWIHSSSLSEKEIDMLVPATPWKQGEVLRLVTVGRVTRGKNMATCIRALVKIRESGQDATLDLVGDGPMLAELRRFAGELGVGDYVEFHGGVTHERVLQILQNSHIFLFPTRVKEGFPKAVLEAMACGLPVIATAVSVLPGLIGDRNGIVLPEPDAAAVSAAVLVLIADEERLDEMGKKARETSREYTLECWQAIIRERLTSSWGPLQ